MDVALIGRKNKGAPPLPPPVKPPQWRVIVGNLSAGALAGCVVEAALYPLDTIKTRLQMMRSGGGIKALLQAGGGKALYAGITCDYLRSALLHMQWWPGGKRLANVCRAGEHGRFCCQAPTSQASTSPQLS
jgi:hypothetical protein